MLHAVNRGAALWNGRVYVGTLDGRLVALDAKTGIPVWSVVTVDQSQPYTITGAPRVVKGKVLIGNGGAEFGVRGYISAYDAETGAQVWRFYTVPGDPSLPFEQPILAEAAKPGKGNGGSSAAAPCGTRWPTIPSSTCCTWARGTARRGTRKSAAPAAATISFSLPSSR